MCIEIIQKQAQKYSYLCLLIDWNFIRQGHYQNTVTVDNLRYSQATRNELLARLLSELTLDDDMRKQVVRRHFLERRGEGVGIILNESEALSGKIPIYEMFDEELRLTIFAAKSPHEADIQ